MQQGILYRFCSPFCAPFFFVSGLSLFFRFLTPHFSSPPSLALILVSDFVAILLFCFADCILHLLLFRSFWIDAFIRSLLLFFFAVIWVLSRKYYALYEAEFAWSHLGQEGFDPNLWVSLASELDWPTQLRLWGAFFVSILYFFVLSKSFLRKQLPKTLNFSFFFETAFAQSLFVLGAVLFVIGYFLFFGKAMHPLYVDEGNVFCRLLYLPHLGDALPAGTKDGLGANESTAPKKGKDFSFSFDTASLVEKRRHEAIPFPGRGRKYNIVLYILESTSHRYMGLRDRKDRPITPYWDRFSQRALLFEKHYAQNPLSINAIFNLLTSAYPLPADRWAAKDYPAIPLASLPSVLRKNGYKNAIYHGGYFAYAGAGHFLRHRGFDEMFDVRQLKAKGYQRLNWGVDDRAYIQPALRFARSAAKAGRPFFITFLPITPHHPYESPDVSDFPELPKDRQGARGSNFRKYIKALHFSDLVMGQTVEAFLAESFGRNTLFFILADHGEAFGQHRRNYNHPFFIYEENVHVPFMIYAPFVIRHPRTIQKLSRHIDIFPTILDILQIPAPETVEGRSLLQASVPQFAPLHTTWRHYLVGLRDGNFKYIYNKRSQKAELYDLAKDPLEKKNILKNHKWLGTAFFAKLQELERHQRRYFERVLHKKIRWEKRQDKENY